MAKEGLAVPNIESYCEATVLAAISEWWFVQLDECNTLVEQQGLPIPLKVWMGKEQRPIPDLFI